MKISKTSGYGIVMILVLMVLLLAEIFYDTTKEKQKKLETTVKKLKAKGWKRKSGRKKKIRNRILKRIVLVILGALIGVNIYHANAKSLLGNDLPMPLGYGISVVLSGSMEPTLKVGDLIIVKAYGDDQEPKIDDVIVYQSGTMSIVHRVVAIYEDTIITQGDANNAADEPFPVFAVKGREIFAIPLIGYLVLMLKTPIGIILTLGLAILLLEQSFQKEKKQKEDQLEVLRAEIRGLLSEQEKEIISDEIEKRK